jgi:pSer/pThr/pTyr-binding forkhead associated (FHA) protein
MDDAAKTRLHSWGIECMDTERKPGVDPILAYIYGQDISMRKTPAARKGASGLLVEYSNEKIQLNAGSIFIGSAENNDICLADDPAVERFQATINFQDTDYILENKSQANTTLLNGKPVKQQKLSAGDIIMAGTTRIRVL